MLQTATVDPATLALLKRLMADEAFKQFNLVGGTALALQIGHRISIDLDLFTCREFSNSSLIDRLQFVGNLEILVDSPPFLQVRLNDIKVDFLKFPYELVENFHLDEGVRLVEISDIAVMKLLAISRRGSKKDFVDLFFILKLSSLEEILERFRLRIPGVDMFHVVKSLTYFGDADPDADPKMFQKIKWAQVKKAISKAVHDLNYR